MGNKSSSSASGDGDYSASTIVADTASTIVSDTITGSYDLWISYSVTKGLGVGNSIDSGSFRVAGHTWCIRYYPDGLNTNCADWISLYLVYIPPVPADTKTVVRAGFKFSFLDQEGNPVAYQRYSQNTVDFLVSNAWGFAEFIRRKGVLEGSNYLKDDSFGIRCEVTVLTKGFTVVKGSRKNSMRNQKFVTVPSSKLNEELRGVLWAGAATDVTFDVDGEELMAHRKVLAARSPVFKAELFGAMMENSASRVQIDDMEPNVFRAMLHFIYTDSIPSMDMEDTILAQHLLVAADRYDLSRLKLICEDKLCNHIDNNNVAETLVLAEQHGCMGLKKACFAFLMSRGNLRAAMATKGYDHLRRSCPSLIDELISNLAP